MQKVEKRLDIYLWENLEHLQKAYPKVDVDEVVRTLINSGTFKEREGATQGETEAALCNAVESIILKSKNYKIVQSITDELLRGQK